MYFVMHCVKQVSSLLDSELPGVGMHLSKQCSLILCNGPGSDEGACQRWRTILYTSINTLAFAKAASCRISAIMAAVLGSEEGELFMVSMAAVLRIC